MPDKSPLDLIRENIKALLAERETHQQRMDAVLAGVEQRGDGALTEDEEKEFAEARDAAKAADEKRAQLEAQETGMLEAQRARDAAAAASKRYTGSDAPTNIRVGNEPTTYRAGGPHSFFRDAYVVSKSAALDPDAAERIVRHQRENSHRVPAEKRATGTGAFGALVVPQFLTDMHAEVVRAGRPLLNTLTPKPLPAEGTVLNIPRGTTGTIVASQTGENISVTEQDYDVTDLVVNMRTIAGQQNTSRQALDRGTPGLDQIIMADLSGAYAAELDRQVINGVGGNSEHVGILSVTAIDTVTFSETGLGTTVPVFYAKVADAIQRINSTRFLPATAICMHPRRWGWITSARDTNGRPLALANSQAPQNAIGVGVAAEYGQVVGTMLNLPVITDANIPTSVSSSTVSGSSEDVVIVYRSPDLHLWESSPEPTQVEFHETLAGQLTVKVVAWGYTFFTAERYPTATVVISGSSLTTPVFS